MLRASSDSDQGVHCLSAGIHDRRTESKSVVSFHHVSKHYGGHDVLTGVSFQINPGDRVGLIGANGAGKSTVLHLLLGAQRPSAGNVVVGPDLKIGHVPQQLEAPPAMTVRDFLLGQVAPVEEALRAAERALAEAADRQMADALQRYQSARDRYDAAGGDQAGWQADRVLQHVGLTHAGAATVRQLSGGERNLLALARALMMDPGLLVLDEPGNHLDYAGLEWLEEALVSFAGAVLLVSHNRRLLDRTVTRILELKGGRVREYAGNYSDYQLTRLQGLVAQRADYVASQKRLAQLEALVARLAAIASVRTDKAHGKRLRARRTQLAREESRAVARPDVKDAAVSVVLPEAESRANVALQVIGYDRSFGDRVLFRDACLEIACGERLALVGPNGCGKSTLLRDIVAHGDWEHPVLRVGPSLTIGYCAQHQETLEEEQTILEAFLAMGLGNRQSVLAALSGYLFTWDDLDKPVGALSGGERNRLQLAAAVQRKASFLILDEPTNHMDIPSCEAIEDALVDYSGTVLVVSHDRYLLDKVATAVVEVRDHGLHRFVGGFSEYWAWRKRRESPAVRAGDGRKRKPIEPSTEARIERLESEKQELERQVSEALQSGDRTAERRHTARLQRVVRQIDRLYEEWAGS